jgi:phosphatidate cytidylyltransferase
VSRSLQLRLLTAAIGMPILLLLIWIGNWPFAIAAGLVTLGATIELTHGWLFPQASFKETFRLGPLLVLPAIMVTGIHFDIRFLIAGAILAVLFVIGGCIGLPHKINKSYLVTALSIIYPAMFFSTFVLTRELDDGKWLVLLIILSTFTVDTGAYFVGSRWGKHKLAPKISPNKTWEGVVGGFLGGVIAVLVLNILLSLKFEVWQLITLILLVPFVAQLGDLTESWMKRRMGLKDTSGLLPGHGGLLDRLDSIVFVSVLVYLVTL